MVIGNAGKNKRFGEALRNMFIARGCDVERVETPDKAVVDLVVSMGGNAFYCRCDGHADRFIPPESVQEALELASRRKCRAIIFTYDTPPGLKGGNVLRKLGVVVFDRSALIKLAQAARFETPIHRRSRWQRFLRIGAKRKCLSRWPRPPESI